MQTFKAIYEMFYSGHLLILKSNFFLHYMHKILYRVRGIGDYVIGNNLRMC